MQNRAELDADYRTLDRFSLLDLEAVRFTLRGGSVIDWHRVNFADRDEAAEFLRAQEMDPEDAQDEQRMEQVKNEAIGYLRRNFDFPVPKPVAQLDMLGLLHLASGRGHRQLCACTILKVMHIIHHLAGRELLFMLPISDQEVFALVEEKVYRVIGGMLAHGFPILEFIGGRKNKDSLYTKLLSKPETIAANIYDKVRFRIVTRSSDDIFSVLNYMLRHIFPFNYVIRASRPTPCSTFARTATAIHTCASWPSRCSSARRPRTTWCASRTGSVPTTTAWCTSWSTCRCD